MRRPWSVVVRRLDMPSMCSGRPGGEFQTGLHFSAAIYGFRCKRWKRRSKRKASRLQKSRLTSTCAAFEALNSSGARLELFVDPTNGEIVGKA